VFITEYPTNAYDASGKLCTAENSPFPSFSEGTWGWLAHLGRQLNNRVASAAETNGWTLVTGIADAFLRHGYCAGTQSYFRRVTEAALNYNLAGGFHPNLSGHHVSYVRTVSGVCTALYDNPRCDGLPPP
jgi:hypothetical protein